MKKQFVSFKTVVRAFLIIILYASCAPVGQAQNHAMKLTLGTSDYLKLGGEKMINPYMSAVVNMNFYDKSYRSSSLFNRTSISHSHSGVRVNGEYRLYLSHLHKTLSGFYIAPTLSVGSHSLKYSQTTTTGGRSLVGGLLSAVFWATSVAITGDLSHSIPEADPEVTTTVTGNAKVTSVGAGLNIGFQYRWSSFMLDCGARVSKNSVRNSKSIPLSNGGRRAFPKEVSGERTEIYVGVGCAF